MKFPGRLHPMAAEPFLRAIDRAAGGRPIPGNRVDLLFDGPMAFDAMLEIIARAERWVHFDNYIFHDDHTGRRFADLLINRAREGLAVRVSCDWLGSAGTPTRFWRRLQEGGVEVRHFHRPGFLDFTTILSRNHRKLIVADGRQAVLGGICIGDEWAGDPAKGRLPWRDTAIRVEGPAAAALDQAFQRTWAIGATPLPDTEAVAEVPAVGEAEVRVLAGEPGQERAYRTSELLLATAASRVWFTDAYLVAPRRLFRYLVDAAHEGVDVRLLVPGTSDLPLVRNFTRFGYRELLQSGVRIFEWKGPMLHAKTVVADGRWVRVGSSNMNHSSLVENYELDVLVDEPALAEKLEAQFRRDLDQSAEVTLRPVRAPVGLRRVLPPALGFDRRGGAGLPHRRGLGERGHRSVLAMRTLVAGARLAVFGPLAFGLALVGLLFFAFPRPMGVIFGIASTWLAMVSLAKVLRRRRDSADQSLD